MIIRAWVRIEGRRLLYVGEPDSGILTTEDRYRSRRSPVGSVVYGVVTLDGEQVGYADDLEWLRDPVPPVDARPPAGAAPR